MTFHCLVIPVCLHNHLPKVPNCFQVLAIVNKATVNMAAQVSVWTEVFRYLGKYQGAPSLDHMVKMSSLRNSLLGLFCIPTSNEQRFRLLQILTCICVVWGFCPSHRCAVAHCYQVAFPQGQQWTIFSHAYLPCVPSWWGVCPGFPFFSRIRLGVFLLSSL